MMAPRDQHTNEKKRRKIEWCIFIVGVYAAVCRCMADSFSRLHFAFPTERLGSSFRFSVLGAGKIKLKTSFSLLESHVQEATCASEPPACSLAPAIARVNEFRATIVSQFDLSTLNTKSIWSENWGLWVRRDSVRSKEWSCVSESDRSCVWNVWAAKWFETLKLSDEEVKRFGF